MPAKLLALAAQAGLAFVAWWMTRPDHERQQIQAALWRELEQFAMGWAKDASNLAAYAERKYKQTVTV
jgi:hypothetical protein